MPVKARDVIRALEKKGFGKNNSKDIRYVYYKMDGKKSKISTMISHGEIEIGDTLLGRMSSQMNISRSRLNEFIECSLTQEQYQDLAIGDTTEE